MNGKKWSLIFLSLYVAALIGIGVLVIIVDPYFHFHEPIKGMSYSLDNTFYINDGISKRFPYTGMITGTSTTRSLRTKQAEELFGGKFVRVTYHGEGFKGINDNLRMAIRENPNLNLVVRGIDPIWFITDENWQGYEEYPEYLFDDIVWNDVNYLYNKEILWNDVIGEVVRTIRREPVDTFDDVAKNDTSPGRDAVLEGYERPEREYTQNSQKETDAFFELMDANLTKNVLSVVEENPDVTFYLFFPPYSICWWDSLHQSGEDILTRRIDMEQAAIEKLLGHDNVRLFSFFNNYALVCNLDNYVDEVHYSNRVSDQILQWMKDGEYELTEDNYLEYIAEIRTFYTQYDYDSMFAEGG